MREDIPAAAYIISRALVTNPNSIAFWGGKDEKHRARIAAADIPPDLQVACGRWIAIESHPGLEEESTASRRLILAPTDSMIST